MRLQLRKQQAEAGDIILLYGDESEALTHPYLARAWAKTGADLRVPAPGQAKKVALLGSLDHAIRELVVHTSPTKRSSDFVAHLEQLDRLYGPKPGQPLTPVVLVEDNGPIHTSKLAMAALATRAHWLTVEWLPKYAPELNDIETVWRDLKAHHLAHQTFDDIDALDDAIHQAVDALNAERAAVPLARLRISAMKIASRALASRGLNRGFECDAIAEACEAAFEVGDGSGVADLVEIRFAELAIGQVLGEHVIGGDEDFVSDGKRRAQGAAAGLEAVELVLEIAALGSPRGNCGADQDGAEVDIALSGAAALLPAGALVAAGTDAGPGAQVIDAQEHAHVDADLGDQHRGDKPVDARDLRQERVRHPIRLEPLADAQVERCDVRLDRFEPAQLHRQEETMVLLRPPVERQDQIGPLASQLALGEIRHRLGRGFARDQRPEHRPAGHAENVGSHARQFDVGGLKKLQEPVAFGRLALHQLAAVTQQLAQFPQRPGRHEALGDQAMSHQIGDPFGILHIGLAPRHVADVPGVADDQFEMFLQDGVDRAPVDARALHPDVRHGRRPQPVPQHFEVPRHRAKRPHLLGWLRPGHADQNARYDRLLMHIQTAAPLNDRLHRRLLPSEGDRDAAGTFETLPYVLPVPGGDKERYLYAARAGLLIGVVSHRRDVSLDTVTRREALTNRSAAPPFSSIMARRRR